MSTTHDEIQIDLDEIDAKKKAPDAAAAANGKKEPKKDLADVRTDGQTAKGDTTTDPKAEEGLEKLKKQLESETAARIDADRRAQESAESEASALAKVQTSQLDQVKVAIDVVTQAQDALEAKSVEAMAAQDWAANGKIQREMATNAAKLLALENNKVFLEKQPKPTPRPSTDKIEEYVGRIGQEFPRSRAWVRAHPEFVRDDSKNRLMLAAHELALARGLKADSDEYFDSIEGTLDLRRQAPADPKLDEGDPMKDAASRPTRKVAPAAAPVTRSGNGTGARPNSVTLSPDEVEMAERTGQTVEEYARNKVALKKEGRLN